MHLFNRSILAVVLITLISGCLVGPSYQRPAMPNPSSYHEISGAINTKDSIVNLKWFDFFGDQQLKVLLDSTLKRNLNLKVAVSRLDQAQEAYGIAKAQLLPSLDYSAGASQHFSNNNSNTFSIGAGISWEIDVWGKIRHAKRAALDDVLASQEGKKAVQSALVAAVATAYFQLRDYDNRVAISKATYNTRLESYNLQQERFSKGYISEWDVLQSKQLMEDAKANIAAYERAAAITEHYLCALMASTALPIQRGLENSAQPQPPVIPSGLPSAILQQRPDVRQAEYVYMREVEKIGIYQAQRYPSLQLTGFFGNASSDLSKLFSADAFAGSITEGILGPIFAFGKNKRRVNVQKKSAEIAAYQYCNTNLQALKEVEDALVSVETLTKELEARKSQTESAKKVVALSQARYDNGFSSYLELLDAQRTLFETELITSNIRQQQLSAYVELYRALGGGW